MMQPKRSPKNPQREILFTNEIDINDVCKQKQIASLYRG